MQQDRVLNHLLIKKKELLSTMLRQSQMLQINENEIEQQQLIVQKQATYENLLKNDAFIKLRENETQVNSQQVNHPLIAEINFIMQSIQENNNTTINRFEKEKTQLTIEKRKLQKSSRLSGYIHQKNHVGYRSRIK